MNDWDIKFDEFVKKHENCTLNGETKKILHDCSSHIDEQISLVKKYLSEGDLEESARIFRRLANLIKDIELDCASSGNYHPKNSLNDLTGKEWLRHTKSWFVKDGKSSDIPKEIKNHPASYPPDLAKHFIKFFTKKQQWVFDPFVGIGSTLAGAQDSDRNCWGCELNPEFANYALSRKKDGHLQLHIHNDDCRNAVDIFRKNDYPQASLLITSPPYWNMLEKSRGGVVSAQKKRKLEGLKEKYSEDDRDLGNISDYSLFLEKLTLIFKNFAPILSDKAHIIIICQNVRTKEGEVKPFAWDLASRLSQHYTLKQEFIWCQDQKFLGIWGYPSTYVSNVHHHYCLVFQK